MSLLLLGEHTTNCAGRSAMWMWTLKQIAQHILSPTENHDTCRMYGNICYVTPFYFIFGMIELTRVWVQCPQIYKKCTWSLIEAELHVQANRYGSRVDISQHFLKQEVYYQSYQLIRITGFQESLVHAYATVRRTMRLVIGIVED